MKKLSLILIVLFLGMYASAQISTKQVPRSFSLKSEIEIPTTTLSSPDVDALMQEDEINARDFFKPQRCAVAVPMFENYFDKAKHISFDEYDLYLLKVVIPYAQAIGFSSDNFYLPKGGELYLYNTDRSKVLGAFTSDNNTEEGVFVTEYVYGEELIIEYYQPKNITDNAKIELSEFVYFYRDVIHFEDLSEETDEYLSETEENAIIKKFRDSGSCNVNVNCSEGSNYQDVKKAVCRIQVRGGYSYYFCTGTLINNTSNDKTPYVIAAGHCVSYSSTSDYNSFIFYFNYEASGCSTPNTEPGYTSLTGCTRLAYDNTYGDNGTDHLLVRLKSSIPSSLNPYFAGWSRSTTAPNKGVCIHHPSGDIKKISTFTQKPTAAEGYTTTHWRVYWAQTTNGFGIVEGGSSGSGLFNTSGLLVGTLTGGYSDCSNSSASDQRDWYGQFNKQFQYLSQWLDPSNTGVTTLNGIYYNQQASLDKVETNPLTFSVYPSPAKDNITISIDKPEEDCVVSVLDNIGRSLISTKMSKSEKQTTLNVSSLTSGVYFIRLYSNKNSYVQKFVKE